MTTPGDNSYNRGDNEGSQNQPYPPSNHPEDQPGFGGYRPLGGSNPGQQAGYGNGGQSAPGSYPGQNTSGQGYPGQGYGGQNYPGQSDQAGNAYGAGYGYQPTSDQVPNYDDFGNGNSPTGGSLHPEFDKPFVVSDEGPDVFAAIRYGFTATFRRPLPWIVGTLVGFIIYFVLNFIPYVSILAPLLLMAVMPLVYRAAFLEIDGFAFEKERLTQGFSWLRAILTSLLVGIVASAVFAVAAWPVLTISTDASGMPQDVSSADLIRLLLGAVLYLLVTMFFQFSIDFVIDQDYSIGSAIKASLSVVFQWFWKLLAWNLLVGFIILLGAMVTLTIGMIILFPFMVNSHVYVYRQVSQRPFPDFTA